MNSCPKDSREAIAESQLLVSDHRRGGVRNGLVGRAADGQQLLAYAQACWPDGTPAEQQLLALHLAAILALDDALEVGQPLSTLREEQRTLLPWSGKPSTREGAAAFITRDPIRAALAQAEKGLASITVSADQAIDWWRREGELTVAAIWEESQWRSRRRLPDENEYLAVAEVSIGIRWIMASLLLLDGATEPPAPDSPVLIVTSVAAASIRVANDLHDAKRERREGKIQLLFLRTMALEARGYTRRAAQRRARRELEALLIECVARTNTLLDPSKWAGAPRLRSAIAGMLAAALKLIHSQGSLGADASGVASGCP